MKLSEFKRDLVKKVDSFVEYWEEQSGEDPDEYPLNMNSGEWDEQFFDYLEVIYDNSEEED